MLMFASPVPSVFSGLDALQPRHVERPSAEEQYFQRLAEEHERAAALARKRLTDVRRQRQQQQALEAQLALQQQLAAAFHTPQRPSYHPARRALPSMADVILGFGASNERESYAEYVHRQTQERQKRVEQQAAMRALFEQQRRAQAERVAELQRKRALEAKAEQERQRKAQEEARRQQAARAADEEKIRQFFQALMGAVAQEGADLERKNAIRRNSAPAQEKPKDTPAPAPAPKSAPVSPKAPERAASPAPSVASDASDASLNSIALLQDKYDTLRSNFTFPAALVFAPSTSSPNASPSLLYNPTNAPVHAYEHALTNLLTELDAVESFGDSHVRDVRRSLARSVEAELEALEVKKRDAWRSQSVKVEVEAPVTVESVPVESAPAPVVESAPVEPTPATESAPAPESTPVDPVEFLATRLAVPTESEDDEVKAVRESLLASLTTEPAPVSTEADKDEVVHKDEPVAESESAADNTTELEATPVAEPETTTATEAETVAETTPTETESEPVVESVPEPEVTDTHTPIATPEIVVSVPEPATVAPEPEVTPASPVESVASSSDPEVVHHEVEPTVAVQPEPESVAQPESDSPASTVPESAPALPESEPIVAAAHSEPESATQPEPEHSAFVKVYADSESGSESDLASELAERKSTAGDEFELL